MTITCGRDPNRRPRPRESRHALDAIGAKPPNARNLIVAGTPRYRQSHDPASRGLGGQPVEIGRRPGADFERNQLGNRIRMQFEQPRA